MSYVLILMLQQLFWFPFSPAYLEVATQETKEQQDGGWSQG